MAFNTATQAQRDALVLAIRKAYPLVQPSINSRSLPGVGNVTTAEANEVFQALADALLN
jgi:hypothetical protein